MTRRFCTFALADLVVAIDVARMQEVLQVRPTTPVPLADPSVEGLLNLRGEIITVVDGRRRLGLPAREPHDALDDGAGLHVIARGRTEPVGLVVDGEGEVVEIDDEAWEPVPGTVGAAIRAHTRGAVAHPTGLLLELDPDSALAPATT